MNREEIEMELALIASQQVSIFFVLMLVGYVSIKWHLLKSEARHHLSNLLVSIISPCMLLNSYMSEFDAQIFHGIVLSFLHGFILILIGLVIALLAGRFFVADNRAIFEFALIFSNAGFMGFPLIQALFGNEGVMYASGYLTAYNILLWSFGTSHVSGQLNPKQVIKSIFLSPSIMAIIIGLFIYLLHIPVPMMIHKPISMIGDMNTPVSMMITGIILADANLGRIIRDKTIAAVIALRLLLIPGICLLIYGILHIQFGMASDVVLLLEACPCASISSVFAVQYHYNEERVAGAVILSTILSILTLPVAAYIITSFL